MVSGMRFGKILPIVNLQNKLAGLRAPEQANLNSIGRALREYRALPATANLQQFKLVIPVREISDITDTDFLKQCAGRFALLAPANEANFQRWMQLPESGQLEMIWQVLRAEDILRLQESSSQMFACTSEFLRQAEMHLFILKQKGAKLWLLDSKDLHSARLCRNLELDWLPDLSLNSECNSAEPDSAATRSRLLRLLSLVVNDADTHEIEGLFKQDSHLSYQLLKLVSSAAFAKTLEIQNFRQAINLLGRTQLQRWLQLLLYTKPGALNASINPLLPRAAFRARLMENLFIRQGANKATLDCAYMVGIFSLLDQLFVTEMENLIQPLHLAPDIVAALLHKQGKYGLALSFVEACDNTRVHEVALSEEMTAYLPDQESFHQALLDAYAWVAKICAEF